MDVMREEVRALLDQVKENNGYMVWSDGEFEITLTMYTDPNRDRLARNAARYLGKPDLHNRARPLSVLKNGHVPEIFRGEHAEFEFEGVPREVYDHIVTYTTRDMRVAGGNRALKSKDFAMPSDRMKNPDLVHEKTSASFQNYQDLLDAGETRQVARSAMPSNARMNTFVYQFNFLTLGQALFNQRIWDVGAQGNTVRVVRGMWALCYTMDADLWETFYEYFGTPMLEWKEIRETLRKRRLTVLDLVNALEKDYDDTTPAEEALRQLFGKRSSMW